MERLDGFQHGDPTVIISEPLVATADSSDPLLDESVPKVLHAMRERMAMDVVSSPSSSTASACSATSTPSRAPLPSRPASRARPRSRCASEPSTLVARKVELSQARGMKEPPPDWKLQPLDQYESPTWHQASRRSGGR